jgi:hypothetical protein
VLIKQTLELRDRLPCTPPSINFVKLQFGAFVSIYQPKRVRHYDRFRRVAGSVERREERDVYLALFGLV